MTRQEASAQIGQREFTIGEILKLSAGVFFENIGKWLLLSLIVYLPTGFVLQLVAMNLPLEDLMNAAVAGETAALAHMDWTPYLIYYGMQIGMSLIWVLVNLATAIYTDRWLQASRPAYSFGETFLGAIRRWPAGMVTAAVLFLCVVLLVTMMMFVAVTALPLIMILMVGFIMLLLAVYYISLSVTALRGKMGISAYRYAAVVVRRRIGKTVGLVLLMMLINMALSYVLSALSSSFGLLAGNIWIFSLISALVSVIANLPMAFMGIGVTVYFINQEQLGQPGSVFGQLPGGF